MAVLRIRITSADMMALEGKMSERSARHKYRQILDSLGKNTPNYFLTVEEYAAYRGISADEVRRAINPNLKDAA